MSSPVPRHLRTESEIRSVPATLREHRVDLPVHAENGAHLERNPEHPAKYAPGLPTALVALAGNENVGDPMAGVGRLVEETKLSSIALNEIDSRWRGALRRLQSTYGCEVSFADAKHLPWYRDVLIFSPPYYPRTDRRKLAAHDDGRRGKVVGYRTGYGADHIVGFIGDPSGVEGILIYRNAMREIYQRLALQGKRMIVVVKNQTRLGVELRLDLDTILTAREAGWTCVGRTGWTPSPSLWMRYNLGRATGVNVEDVLVFDKEERDG